MKRVLAIAFSLTLAFGAYAQGVFNGNTSSGGVTAKCYLYWNSTMLLGSSASGQWYVGPANAQYSDLVATGPIKAFNNGYCQVGAVTTPYPAGSTITVQLRAWKGASSYEDAMLTPGAACNRSNFYQISGLATGTALPPSVSIVGFALITPEPSTIALGVLGLSVLLFRRRK